MGKAAMYKVVFIAGRGCAGVLDLEASWAGWVEGGFVGVRVGDVVAV